jgi:RNA polymerase III RPC4
MLVKSEVNTENPDGYDAAPLPSSGKIGQLKVHSSGKTVLSYGGVNFPLQLANDVAFAQDFLVINPGEAGGGKAWRLGSVGLGQEGTWLVGVPDLHSR